MLFLPLGNNHKQSPSLSGVSIGWEGITERNWISRKNTKEIEADIQVIDMPLLNMCPMVSELTGVFISDLVLQILAYVAETAEYEPYRILPKMSGIQKSVKKCLKK